MNLVRFIGVILGDVNYLVTEYMAKGSLVDYLRTRGRAIITASDQINFSRYCCTVFLCPLLPKQSEAGVCQFLCPLVL